jgi:hypothetical protein
LCCKISGEGEYFEGDAIVYENEHDVITGVRGEVKPVMSSFDTVDPKARNA